MAYLYVQETEELRQIDKDLHCGYSFHGRSDKWLSLENNRNDKVEGDRWASVAGGPPLYWSELDGRFEARGLPKTTAAPETRREVHTASPRRA